MIATRDVLIMALLCWYFDCYGGDGRHLAN